jgi:hypothetical protein
MVTNYRKTVVKRGIRMKKSIIAMLVSTLMVLSFLGPIFFNQLSAQAIDPDPTDWYMQVDGVLDTDYYDLYPYNTNTNISLGLSKYGEFINNNTNVGLEYGNARDPWAAPAGAGIDPWGKLPKKVWINGWYIDITYNHSSWGLRNVWAGALFADLTSYGKPWLRVENSYGSCTTESQENFLKPGLEIGSDGTVVGTALAYGGRKTNGTCITDPIEVIYHGPREFVAKLVTHVYDYEEVSNETLHIVDVMFTVIFNKVKKEIIVLKDVKIVDQAKYQISSLKVSVNGGEELDVPFGVLCQFSNREEWDLGTPNLTPKYASYVHFYTEGTALNDTLVEGQGTVYDRYWTILPTLPANVSVIGQRTNVNAYGSEPNNTNCDETYDLAQIISNDKLYVGWAAYWPSLSDWSADAGGGRRNLWWRAIGTADPHDIDSFAYPNDEPFLAPLTVGEWDFMLSDDHRTIQNITADVQFRGVSVYGVTDLNDGQDKNFVPYVPGTTNIVDKEVCYQLGEVFNPFDLHDALTKDTQRWVQHEWGDGVTKAWPLKLSNMFPDNTDDDWPYVRCNDFVWRTDYQWSAYCMSAESVLINGVLQIRGVDYNLTDTGGYMYLNFTVAPELDDVVKILFSTWEGGDDIERGSWEWITVGRDSAPVDSIGAAMVSEYMLMNNMTNKVSAFDMEHPAVPVVPSLFSSSFTGVDRTGLLPDRTGYRDCDVYFNLGRTGFKDDWCSHNNTEDDPAGEWYNGLAISSANIINIGGPLANLGSEYFNDFVQAFYTLDGWTPLEANKYAVMPLTCWSMAAGISPQAYRPEFDPITGLETIGYGVISTYKDINGTIGLNIWGVSGQDTYFTCWAFMHSDVLALMLANARCGLTSLILQFNYTLHPDDYCFVTIVEALGTISELNVQELFADCVTDSTWGGALPTIWFNYDHAGDPTCMTNWPWPDTWITDKYPTIHPDP